MWRRTWITLLGLALAVLPAAWAQDGVGVVSIASAGPCTDVTSPATGAGLPFGYLDGAVDGATGVTGILRLVGWALDDDGVASVDILIDGQVVDRAVLGQSRPGVAALYPGFPDALESGFSAEIDTTRFLNGLHRVSARVTSTTGEVADLNAVEFQFTNLTHALKPFGRIDYPYDNTEVFGVCDPTDSQRRYTVVTGWALDAGVEENDHGMGYVELMIDGVIYANSRRDCFHSPVTGAFTNCYGLRRQDVESNYPGLKDSPHSGFRFVVDVGELIALGWTPGQHVFTIRAGDQDSQVANIDSIVVQFSCDDFFANQGAFGEILFTPDGFATGVLQLEGWALDWEGVADVRIYVDGVLFGSAAYGFANAEVTSLHPGFPDSDLPGWVINLDTAQFSNGDHVIGVVVVDEEGATTLIGQVDLVVKNL